MKNANETKYAVITNMEVNNKVFHCGISQKDNALINIAFYKKLNTGCLQDTICVPNELYSDIIGYNTTNWNGKKTKKYGLVKSKNNGSFSDCFDAKKFRSLKKLLTENGYTIVE